MSYRFPENTAKLEALVKMIKQQPLPQSSNPHLETIALDAGAGLDWQTIIIHDEFINMDCQLLTPRQQKDLLSGQINVKQLYSQLYQRELENSRKFNY